MQKIKEEIKQQGAEDEKSIANIVLDKYMTLIKLDYREVKQLYDIAVESMEQARIKGTVTIVESPIELEVKKLCLEYYNKAFEGATKAIIELEKLHKDIHW